MRRACPSPSAPSLPAAVRAHPVVSYPSLVRTYSNTKLPAPLDVLSIHLTSHRILAAVPPSSSPPYTGPSASHVRSTFPHGLSIPLSHIRQTEFYAGFLTSSAKVTLYLASPQPTPPPLSASASTSSPSPRVSSTPPTVIHSPTPSSTSAGWPCPLCGFANPPPPPGATDKMVKCQMCGVSREASNSAVPSSRPTSALLSTSSPAASPPPPPPPPNSSLSTSAEVPCPTCTFLNHPSLSECEICSSPLPSRARSAPKPPPPSTNPVWTPAPSTGAEKLSTVRLSFRKGGDKEFYKLLKRALADRAWAGGEVRPQCCLCL